MTEEEAAGLLEPLLSGQLTPDEKRSTLLQLKTVLIRALRTRQPVPKPLGYYAAIALEEPTENSFIQVTQDFPLSDAEWKGDFALAWAYDYVEALTERQRKEKQFIGDSEEIVMTYFDIEDPRTLDRARKKYQDLVNKFNEGDIEGICPAFLRKHATYRFQTTGIEPKDILAEETLEPTTGHERAITYLKDGNFEISRKSCRHPKTEVRSQSFDEYPPHDPRKCITNR